MADAIPPAEGGQVDEASQSSLAAALLGAAGVDMVKVLSQAAKEGDVDLLRGLLGGDPLGVQATDPEGWQPLHFAAHAGQAAAVQLLLDLNADPHALKGDRSTALHDAAYQGSEEICATLLERRVDANQTDEDGWGALHFAAASGHAGVVRLLLQQKADPALKTRDSKTAFKLAFAEGHRNVLEVLEEGADVRGEKAELQGAASVRIAELEEELVRVLAEKQELQEALLRKEGAEVPKEEGAEEGKEAEAKETEAKEADAKKRRKKPKKKEKAEGHEQAADALDSSLQAFSSNAENLEKLIQEKRTEMEESEATQFGPEETEVYYERMMELYSLKADAVALTGPRPAVPPEGECALTLAGEYYHLPVTCLVLADTLYNPYFKDRLAREVAFIATVAHPHLATFTGICFQKRFGEPEAARKKKAAQPGGEAATLPYADPSTKDHEICLVYEKYGEPLQALLAEEGFAPGLGDIVRLMLGLTAAVAHVHRRGHVHNAVASATVAVDRRAMGAKLTHFGAAAAANVFRKAKVQRGAARWYCAPEQLDPAPKKTPPPPSQLYDYGSPKQDVYGLGMVLLALCTLKEDNGKPADLAKGIKATGLRDLVYLMTKPRPEDRPTAEEVAAQLAALRKFPEFA
eukprot:EG_transcript_6322